MYGHVMNNICVHTLSRIPLGTNEPAIRFLKVFSILSTCNDDVDNARSDSKVVKIEVRKVSAPVDQGIKGSSGASVCQKERQTIQ
jgi:hypothetical protein